MLIKFQTQQQKCLIAFQQIGQRNFLRFSVKIPLISILLLSKERIQLLVSCHCPP